MEKYPEATTAEGGRFRAQSDVDAKPCSAGDRRLHGHNLGCVCHRPKAIGGRWWHGFCYRTLRRSLYDDDGAQPIEGHLGLPARRGHSTCSSAQASVTACPKSWHQSSMHFSACFTPSRFRHGAASSTFRTGQICSITKTRYRIAVQGSELHDLLDKIRPTGRTRHAALQASKNGYARNKQIRCPRDLCRGLYRIDGNEEISHGELLR